MTYLTGLRGMLGDTPVAVESATAVLTDGAVVPGADATIVPVASTAPTGTAVIQGDQKKQQLADQKNATGGAGADSGSSFSTFAVIGGALAAGYFLFIHKDKKPASP